MRCSMCFADKICSPPYPTVKATCKGCALQIDRVMGFLENSGLGLQMVLLTSGEVVHTITSDSPPSPRSNRRTPLSEEKAKA